MKNCYRNSFHIEPAQGLLNDPNGLIQFKGKYYFFHQWNRFGTDHSYKEWGLFQSDDLLHWQSQGSGIIPDCVDDQDGVYSGSAIEYEQKMYLFYTGNTKTNTHRKSVQKMAISTDGQKFIKQVNTIDTPPHFSEHHRDPKVWQTSAGWWMIVGAQTKENTGAVALYHSVNLLDWDYQGVLFSDSVLDQMCECPDFFSLTEEIDILTVCPQKRTSFLTTDLPLSSYAGYFVGKLDYEKGQFVAKEGIKKLDYGFDFYAPQSFQDDQGRRIMVAWMSRMTEEEEDQCPTKQDGYLHCLTMPRELLWKQQRLYQIPLKEYKNLRKSKVEYTASKAYIQNQSPAYEIVVDCPKGMEEFSMEFNSGASGIHFQDNRLMFSRINWVTQRYESKEWYLPCLRKLQIFCDTSTVEMFVNDGEYVFSMRFFSKQKKRDIQYEKLGNDGMIRVYSY